MDRDRTQTNERKGLALSGLIMGIVGLICAFFTGWRNFCMVISLAGLIVSVYCLRKAIKAKAAKGLATPGILFSIGGLIAASYYLFFDARVHLPEHAATEIPQELRDSASTADQDNSLDQLKNIIDTTQGQ
jgi:hypothetical protein